MGPVAIIRLPACQQVKKKIHCQVIQIHTDTVFDIPCFLESEIKKQQRNVTWKKNKKTSG